MPSTARPPESVADVEADLGRSLLDLVFEAASTRRLHHAPRYVRCSELLSIKTSGCPEGCGYCSQSAHFDTHVERKSLLPVASCENSIIRLSAGRGEASESVQALCFLVGANSIFIGEELLTTSNRERSSDAALLAKLGLEAPAGMRWPPAGENLRGSGWCCEPRR